MKTFIKNVLGYILSIIGILMMIFFRKYSGDLIPYSTIWFFAGFILLFIGYSFIQTKEIKLMQDLADEIDKFKLRADQIKVNLNSCKIKTNNYTEQIEEDDSYRPQLLNSLSDYTKKEMKHTTVYQSVLIYETDVFGQKAAYYSPTIYMDEISLKILLDREKETSIYVDRDNRNKYYFDLEFLRIPPRLQKIKKRDKKRF